MKKIFLTMMCIGLMVGHSFAQNRITGKVVDENNDPVVGAFVLIVGKSTGTSTDAQGRYAITATQGETLRFTCLGYTEKEVKVTSSNVLDVVLPTNMIQLEEAVAIGYGSVRKSDLTGSVSSLKSETLTKSAPVSLSQGLEGRLAGVFVQQMDGAPGSGVSIEIRGANSFTGGTQPLYVVDDIPWETISSPGATANDYSASNPLSLLNPNDIENIVILKDASATAIYGARGANGVVLITTKQGKAGRSSLDISINQGWSVVNKTIHVLDAYAYAKMYVEARLNSSIYDNENNYLARNQVNYLDAFGSRDDDFRTAEYYKTHSTDWQDLIFQNGRTTDLNVALSGGTDKVTYRVSANFIDQAGIIKSSGYQRAGLLINLNGDISPRVKFQVSSNFSWDNNRYVRTGSDVGQQGGAIKSSLRFPPIYSPYTVEGDVADEWYDASNPITYVTSQKNDIINFKNTLSGYLEGKITKDLKLRVRFGINYGTVTREQYLPIGTRESRNGRAYYRNNQNTKILNDYQLTYDKKFNKSHALNAVAVFSWEEGKSLSRENTASNFLNDALLDNAMQTGADNSQLSNGRSKNTLASYLGRVNYTFRDKYYLTASLRADGSSRFAVNNKWAYFPAAAIAYRLDREPFLKNSGIFDQLKLRVSYGEAGNQGISSYGSLTRMSTSFYAFDRILYTGAAISSTGLGNDNLTWETTATFNAAVDISVLRDRLTLTVEYYKKKTRDLLQQQELPLSLGYSRRWVNMGSLENKGIEISVGAIPISKRNFFWSVDFNIFNNVAKVLSLGEGISSQTVDRVASDIEPFQLIVGRPLGEIWAYKVLGVYQNLDEVRNYYNLYSADPNIEKFMVGEYKYQNTDGNDVINTADRVVVGNTTPKFLFGLGNNFSIGRLDISFFIQGSYGNDIINGAKWDMLKNI